MKKSYLVLFVIIPMIGWNGFNIKAQDLHFSQYQETTSLINPALTGAQNILKASVIYKSQWGSVTDNPYKTYGACFENRFSNSYQRKKGKHLPKNRKNTFKRFAFGLAFYNDIAGDGNMGVTMVNLSLATFVPTGDKSSLSVGLQAGVVQQKVNLEALTFPDQYTGTGYNNNLPNGENQSAQNFLYPDFSGGLNWNYGFDGKPKKSAKDTRANIGVSLSHFNEPKQEFLKTTDEKLDMKFIAHANLLYGIAGTPFAVAPSFIYFKQGPAQEMMGGLMLKYYLASGPRYYGAKASSALGVGISYRNKDAAILNAVLEFGQFAVGFSYDLNISLLNNVSKVKGGPEFFLRFVTPNPFGTTGNPKKRYNL